MRKRPSQGQRVDNGGGRVMMTLSEAQTYVRKEELEAGMNAIERLLGGVCSPPRDEDHERILVAHQLAKELNKHE